jgi:hypothetical protein
MSKQTNKEVISEEVAVNEVLNFINFYSRKPIDFSIAKEKHELLVEAVMNGNLIFEDTKKPIYTLVNPIISESKEVLRSTVEFKTRIKPTTRADLAKGIDLQKDQANFSLKVISYIIGSTVKELDLFEPIDYDVISEISAVFMIGGR